MFFFLPPGAYYRGRGRGKKQKPKKAPKPNWFAECNLQQLKDLCKACKLPVSGNKSDLIQRLLGCEAAAKFSCNKNGYMMTLEQCKNLCREKLLQVGGSKYDLILRILQHDHDTGGDSLKRAATETVTVVQDDGQEKEVQVAKKRKTSNSKPKPATFASRIQKKIYAVSQKKYQSYWGAKSHAPDVCMLMGDLFSQAKKYLDTDPRLAYNLITAIFSSFATHFDVMQRPGYCEDLGSMVGELYDIFETLQPVLEEASLLDEAVEWLEALDSVCAPYGLLDDLYCSEQCNIEATIRMLKKGASDDEHEEGDDETNLLDTKPAAAAPAPTPSSEFEQALDLLNTKKPAALPGYGSDSIQATTSLDLLDSTNESVVLPLVTPGLKSAELASLMHHPEDVMVEKFAMLDNQPTAALGEVTPAAAASKKADESSLPSSCA